MLFETTTDGSLLEELVARLTEEVPGELRPTEGQIRHAFTRHSGNLREALLNLYDVFEQTRRGRKS